MNILITICARGGSKGIPGKNIKVIGGKPLIGYTIDIAKDFAKRHHATVIALSTDSYEIKTVANDYGLISDYERPAKLATDTAGKIDAIKDVFLYEEAKREIVFDYVLDLDVTSPLRNLSDLERAFELIKGNKEAVNLFSVNDAERNPYFNMVEENSQGFFSLVKSFGQDVLSRQKAPKVFELNASFYIYKREFFKDGYNVAITDKSIIYEMPHICFDLDHPIDFEFLSYLIDNNKLDFTL